MNSGYNSTRDCGASRKSGRPDGAGLPILLGDHELLGGNEIIAAGLRRQILICGTGVLTAAGRPQMIDGTEAQPLLVITQKWAWIRKLATLPATIARPPAIGRNRQQRRHEPPEFTLHASDQSEEYSFPDNRKKFSDCGEFGHGRRNRVMVQAPPSFQPGVPESPGAGDGKSRRDPNHYRAAE